MQLDLVLQFTKNSDGMWWYTYQAAGNFVSNSTLNSSYRSTNEFSAGAIFW